MASLAGLGLWPFLACVAFFHCSEYALACAYMRDELSIHSWLISKPYAIAMAGATIEYLVEARLFSGLKQAEWLARTGLMLMLLGEVIRKTGMVTAKASFTHNIRHTLRPNHHLITWGIYRYIRHPGYLGWYIWCIGTQIQLLNPISCVVFAVVAWRFFKSRIDYEEYHLRRFFGQEYIAYAARTPTYIPFLA